VYTLTGRPTQAATEQDTADRLARSLGKVQ